MNVKGLEQSIRCLINQRMPRETEKKMVSLKMV